MVETRVAVDRERCVASTHCVSIARQTFAMVDGFAAVVGSGDTDDDLEDAVDSCPAGAIDWLAEPGT